MTLLKIHFYLYFIACGSLIVCFHPVLAQTATAGKEQKLSKEKRLFSASLGLQHGFIFAHSQAVQNTKGAHPTGLELIMSWQRNDSIVWDLCNCYPRQGLLMAYYDYDNIILGKSLSAAYFLEPTYKLSKNLFFSFKGASGLSYLTHPFDSISNPTNQSYSTHLSAYLLVGLGLWLKLNQHWWINASANYQHESNGGMRQPNKGINWPTIGLALSYQKTSKPFYSGAQTKEKFWKQYSLRLDAALFGIPRRSLDENGNSRRLPLIGLSVQTSKQVGRISALTMGVEVYRDEELRLRLKQDSLKGSPVKSGILVGHEFLLGKFIFSQRLGFYVFNQTPYYDQLYHRWGLHYRINRHVGIGFNLQAHRQVADFVDLRVTYTIQRKYN
jgi:hypothetical protein